MKYEIAVESIPYSCLAVTSRLASRMTTKVLGLSLEPLGLDPTQFPIMVALYLHPGIVVYTLSNFLDIEASAISRNVQTLEKKGLVVASGGRGRRGKKLSLSSAGHSIFLEAVSSWQEAQELLIAEIGADEMKDLIERLKSVSAAAQRILARKS